MRAQQRADPAALVGWIQGLGQFTSRQLVIIGFVVLAPLFLYQGGESPAREVKRTLRHLVSERAEAYESLPGQGSG